MFSPVHCNIHKNNVVSSKSLANRLKKFLPTLINHDQTVFQKNRFIEENNRLISNIHVLLINYIHVHCM